MKRGLFLALCVLAAVAGRADEPSPSQAPVEWSVAAAADKNRVQVGEDLELTITVRHPPGGQPIPPPATAFGPFEVVGSSEERVDPTETRLRFRLAAFRLPESLEIPEAQVRYRDENGEIQVLTTVPIPVELVTSLSPEVTSIHDIKEPVDLEVPRDLGLLWWLLAGLGALLVAYLIYRKLRKRESAAAPVWAPPPAPPEVEAEEALRRLAEKKLVSKGEISAFYTELSEIMKRYAGRRFEVPYLESTTSEVVAELKRKKLAMDVIMDLRAILDDSDMVKFAKLMPEASHADRSLELAFSWIGKTRPVPTPEPAHPAETRP